LALGHCCRVAGRHLGDIVVIAGAHACAHDIEEGQHARLGRLDHPFLEFGEFLPAGRARIDHGRHPAAEGEGVGLDPFAGRRSGRQHQAGEQVGVNVDQAGRDIEALRSITFFAVAGAMPSATRAILPPETAMSVTLSIWFWDR
jgi:hypothetical protein